MGGNSRSIEKGGFFRVLEAKPGDSRRNFLAGASFLETKSSTEGASYQEIRAQDGGIPSDTVDCFNLINSIS